MTLGGMIATQYIIGQLNSPIEQMISFVQSWQLAKISLDRLNEIHELRDEEEASPIPSEGGGKWRRTKRKCPLYFYRRGK